MGRYLFKLPDIGEGIAEAEVVEWHVALGDTVEEDQILADLMTDKATVEMSSPVAGTVVSLGAPLGEKLSIGATLVELEVADEAKEPPTEIPSPPLGEREAPAKREGEVGLAAPSEPTPPHPDPLPPNGAERGKSAPLASPAVRQRAKQLGIDLSRVPATGEGSRITHADLDAYLLGHSRPIGATTQRDDVQEVNVIGLRRRIAEKMQEAKRHIPHFAYVDEIDVTELELLRAQLNAVRESTQPKLTVLPLLITALTRILPKFPQINATYDDTAGTVRRYGAVHVGIAAQTPNGLMVPVLRHAEALGVWQMAAEITRLAAAARDGTPPREELSGSTITVTSLGPLGGIATTPIINYPEVAIIGPNRIVERPVVRDGQIVIRKMMNLSSSFDHRVVDGYDAAEFIQGLKGLLEHPAAMFVT